MPWKLSGECYATSFVGSVFKMLDAWSCSLWILFRGETNIPESFHSYVFNNGENVICLTKVGKFLNRNGIRSGRMMKIELEELEQMREIHTQERRNK